jgi:hypothetical protein
MHATNCCLQFSDYSKGKSPFDSTIVFGYFDGPLEGIAKCNKCGRVYYYRTVAWDTNTQDQRLYVFAQLPSSSFMQFETELRNKYEPKYPCWVIHFQSEQQKERKLAQTLISSMISNSEKPSLLVLSDDILAEIQVIKIDDHLWHKLPKEWLCLRPTKPYPTDDIVQWRYLFQRKN